MSAADKTILANYLEDINQTRPAFVLRAARRRPNVSFNDVRDCAEAAMMTCTGLIIVVPKNGFSLVELAVVLIVVSLLLVGLLGPLTAQQEQKKTSADARAANGRGA